MKEPSVHVNIHANHPDVTFQPVVTDLESSGQEKDVLVAACETYPLTKEAAV